MAWSANRFTRRSQAIPREKLRYLQHVIVVGAAPATGTLCFGDVIEQNSPQLEAEPTSKDDAAFWLYSSGSTGLPKACVHLQHDMVVCAERYAKGILGMTESDRCFSVAKLFFAYGLGNALYFPAGGRRDQHPVARRAQTTARIRNHRAPPPNVVFLCPVELRGAVGSRTRHEPRGNSCPRPVGHAPDFDLSSVRYGISAGEALPAALFHRFKQRFDVEVLDAIGSTEVLHVFIANRPGAVRPGSSGQIIPGYEAKIVDESDQPAKPDEIGNLLIKSDSTCSHYWNQHEKSKSTIEGHWIRTGDKYYQDADGYFWYAGRSDDMLKCSGAWVSPIEIESVLIEHPAVQEAAVVAREDHDQLLKPAAYVILRNGTSCTPDLARELQEFVVRRLPIFKRPRWVEFVDDLPKTATGKLQRYKLREKEVNLTEP